MIYETSSNGRSHTSSAVKYRSIEHNSVDCVTYTEKLLPISSFNFTPYLHHIFFWSCPCTQITSVETFASFKSFTKFPFLWESLEALSARARLDQSFFTIVFSWTELGRMSPCINVRPYWGLEATCTLRQWSFPVDDIFTAALFNAISRKYFSTISKINNAKIARK